MMKTNGHILTVLAVMLMLAAAHDARGRIMILRAQTPETLRLALFDGHAGRVMTLRADGTISDARPLDESVTTPLGSLWKLFVYIYLTDERIAPPPYVCEGRLQDETFCCQRGKRIFMDEALSRSCGLFFEPKRLKISPQAWENYWTRTVGVSFAWLSDLRRIQPASVAPVRELLAALHRINARPLALRITRDALADVLINGTGRGAVRHLGRAAALKTFTWRHPDAPGKLAGGFAGWLQDGSTVWAMGAGRSHDVLEAWSAAVAPLFVRKPANLAPETVNVAFFARHRIARVIELPAQTDAAPGWLRGDFRIRFASGQTLDFHSNHDVFYEMRDGLPRISGVFPVNDYVARVIDREISAAPVEAAKAFAVVIRTYLRQNAARRGETLFIEDTSRFQRVGIHAPSAAAQAISAWTDGLVLAGAPDVRYHATDAGLNRLSWTQAQALAAQGLFFDQILQTAYPAARLEIMTFGRAQECERLPEIEAWLAARAKAWNACLMRLPGYEPPERVTVCALSFGNAYAEYDANRIFARPPAAPDDEIALAHEFLHLAFKHHPSGADESFIENMARQLLLFPADCAD